MPDFKVTFRGDLGNLAQFDAAIKNSAAASARAIQQANSKIASSVGSISGVYSDRAGAGLFVRNQKAIADSVNNTFRQSGDIIRRYVSGYETTVNKMGKYTVKPIFSDAYYSSFNKALGNLEAYEEATRRVERHEKQLDQSRLTRAREQARNLNRDAKLRKQLSVAETSLRKDPNILSAATIRDQAQLEFDRLSTAYAGMAPGTRGRPALRKQVDAARADLNNATAALAAARLPFETEINKINAALGRLGATEAAQRTAFSRTQNRILSREGYKLQQAALNATPPIQADLARALSESPELQRNLIRGGLGLGAKAGTAEFQRALAVQEAQVTSYTRNLRTNVKTIQGSFKDASGLMSKFTVDIDNQGKVIGRWGGQLGGAGSILRQTIRDFQKVIEWTIATTAVFGTLATVVGQLKNINELNTALARFSLTAQASVGQTNEIFERLSGVAFATATPLLELVTVADDIALATREAGDSTEQWQQKIIDLTTAVGIFTNLTGKDTTAAADQLSAAFKQLDIAPRDLIGVLNKATAVAGGQSNAIADIVQSVSGLAEAAKAAGFSIDEQIASIQVLSQVTNKTSAEIATSFKNLFGSVSSVGSQKILSQFGIEIRDASGGIRDFLDIYRDVSDALKKGIIPSNRLPDVLRGIAGGPRRAPDAAALLANIDRIDAVVIKSQNATNEALVANARILDTNQAKIVQFQNSIDAAVFTTFSQAVRELTIVLADLGIAVSGIIGGINPQIAASVIQIGLLVGGWRALGKSISIGLNALGLSKQGLVSFGKSLLGVGTAATIASAETVAAMNAMAAADARLAKSGLIVAGRKGKDPVFGPSPVGGGFRLPGLLAGRGKLIGGAAVGAAAVGGLAAGGDTAQTVGTLLQTAGAASLLTGVLVPVGIAAIAAGTALQLFTGNTDAAKQSAADLTSEVFNLTERLKTTQLEADEFAKAQKEASQQMQELQSKSSLTADDQIRLTAATQSYVEATLGLAKANRSASDTFDELLQKLDDGAVKYQAFYGAFANSIRAGGIDSPEIKKLSQRLLEDILRSTPGGSVFAGEILPFTGRARFTPDSGTIARTPGSVKGSQVYDLSNLFDNPNDLRKLFDINTGASRFNIPRSDESLAFLQSALSQLQEKFAEGQSDLTKEQLDNLTNAILTFAKETSSFAQNTAALFQARAATSRNQALGLITSEQAANAYAAQNLIEGLLKVQEKSTGSLVGPNVLFPKSVQATDVIGRLGDRQERGAFIPNQEIIDALTLQLKLEKSTLSLGSVYDDLAKKGDDALNRAIVLGAQEAGFSIEQVSRLAQYLNVDLEVLSETAEDFSNKFIDARNAARAAFGDRSLKLLIAENSGEFKGNTGGLNLLKEQNQAAYDSTISLISSIENLSGVAFTDLNNALSGVIGLQGEYIANNDPILSDTEALSQRQAELAGKLIEAAVAAGVNSEGIQKITEKAAELIGVLNAIPTYKRVIVSIETLYSSKGSGLAIPGVAQAINDKYTNALKEQQKAIDAGTDPSVQIKKIVSEINKILGSGSGSSFGQLAKGAAGSKSGSAYNKPGLLDIPEEIIKASNTSELLQTAIKNARNLQSIVPGESKANRNDIVELLNGTKRVLETRGIGEEYLRRAMAELTDEIKRQNDLLSKADTIRRVRVGTGSFAALANVPINSQSGVSVGGPQGPISISLDIKGTVLTPAQFAQWADQIAASLKRQLSS